MTALFHFAVRDACGALRGVGSACDVGLIVILAERDSGSACVDTKAQARQRVLRRP